jgi:hypothetical protein
MDVIPGRRSGVLSRWLVYLAALLVAIGATALLLTAAETETPRTIMPSSHTSTI